MVKEIRYSALEDLETGHVKVIDFDLTKALSLSIYEGLLSNPSGQYSMKGCAYRLMLWLEGPSDRQ